MKKIVYILIFTLVLILILVALLNLVKGKNTLSLMVEKSKTNYPQKQIPQKDFGSRENEEIIKISTICSS